MPPEIGELAFLTAEHKPGGFGAGLLPALASQASHLGKAPGPAGPNQTVVLPFDFGDTVGFPGGAAVAHVVDEEDAGVGDAVEDFPGPLLHQVWSSHHQTGVVLAVGMNIAGRKRHERFAGSALANDLGGVGLAQVLCNCHDHDCLGGKQCAVE